MCFTARGDAAVGPVTGGEVSVEFCFYFRVLFLFIYFVLVTFVLLLLYSMFFKARARCDEVGMFLDAYSS